MIAALAALAALTLIALVFTLVIREHLHERRVGRDLLLADMRADTHTPDDRTADIAAHVLTRVAAERAEDEQARRIERAVVAARREVER